MFPELLSGIPGPDTTLMPEPAGSTACALCEQFFKAGTEERSLILIVLEYAACIPINPPSRLRPADIWRLEAQALQRNAEIVARDLEGMLAISQDMARRIVTDELGEPIAVACKALSVPANVLQRILLFMNPSVGRSVERVYKVAALYDAMTMEAAQRMIDIWQDAAPAGSRNPIHAAQWQSPVHRARQTLADITRRNLAEMDRPPVASPRRVSGMEAT